MLCGVKYEQENVQVSVRSSSSSPDTLNSQMFSLYVKLPDSHQPGHSSGLLSPFAGNNSPSGLSSSTPWIFQHPDTEPVGKAAKLLSLNLIHSTNNPGNKPQRETLFFPLYSIIKDTVQGFLSSSSSPLFSRPGLSLRMHRNLISLGCFSPLFY